MQNLGQKNNSAQMFRNDSMMSTKSNPGLTEASITRNEVTVIGLYGISGSGKTTLMKDLKGLLDIRQFSFYEGSEVLGDMTPGGLEGFQRLDEQQKRDVREQAISKIHKECYESGKTALVTGHFMFWSGGKAAEDIVCTAKDLSAYTHIIYLNISADTIEQRCRNDDTKRRPSIPIDQLVQWQQMELYHLRPLCREHNILLSVVNEDQVQRKLVQTMVQDFGQHDEDYNYKMAMRKVDQAVALHLNLAEKILIIDGDKTLTRNDTGALFWQKLVRSHDKMGAETELKTLFSGPLGYTYTAFRQATLLYEEVASDELYEHICQEVASNTIVHSEFLSLLQFAAVSETIGVILVSCGLKRVWEIVLERENLRKSIDIIAGGRIADNLVVNAATKASIVSHLQINHHKQVWAFGDSPLDLEMLKLADQAFVVVIDQHTRSKSMETALASTIEKGDLQAHQIIIPNTAPPRLDIKRLPTIDITHVDFVNKLLNWKGPETNLPVSIASNAASKLLATPMRDSANYGPRLREAHSQAGWYISYEQLAPIIGVEPQPISHVLGRRTEGSRLFQEDATTIIALMRGGDPMASGVSQAFPRAMYVHMKDPQDLKLHHVQNQAQVVLVDSVINTGKSVIECVEAIRRLHSSIRIIIVAGVIQAQCLYKTSNMYKALSSYGQVHIVALRVSETKFTGSGTTDTGNRLFNTTHLP